MSGCFLNALPVDGELLSTSVHPYQYIQASAGPARSRSGFFDFQFQLQDTADVAVQFFESSAIGDFKKTDIFVESIFDRC